MSRARSSMSITAAIAVALGLVVTIGSAASAASPSNDDRGSATVVSDLPFTDSLDTSEATPQQNDPDCFEDGAVPSVWYSFTPATDGRFVASTAGSGYDTVLTLATATEGGLDIIDCNDDWDDLTSLIPWRGEAGREYLVMVGSFAGEPGGQLQFAIRRAPPPPSYELRVYRRGTLTRGGAAVVRGILRCEGTQDDQSVELIGRQDVRRRIFRGFGSRQVACGEPWTIRVRSGEFRFGPGDLYVRASVDWCNEFDCGTERAQRVVRLR